MKALATAARSPARPRRVPGAGAPSPAPRTPRRGLVAALGSSPGDDVPSSSGPGTPCPAGPGQSGRPTSQPSPPASPPLVRVRLSVHYRVHSRQMLCIGGSTIPFGWSFVSISKVPMAWTPGDVWTAEVDLPAGMSVEYKYVILEEQDWTRQVSEDAEGVASFTYRGDGAEEGSAGGGGGDAPFPASHLDPDAIQRRMAIVAWAPGPNKVVRVPGVGEVSAVPRGGSVSRTPARPAVAAVPGSLGVGAGASSSSAGAGPSTPGPSFGRRADGGAEGPLLPGNRGSSTPSSSSYDSSDAEEEAAFRAGTWEELRVGKESGEALLERRDVWGGPPPSDRLIYPASGPVPGGPGLSKPPPGYGRR